jgi:hypothetical protein
VPSPCCSRYNQGLATVDEELAKLEDSLRRLKIEYEIYFNGSSKRAPRDTLYRVESVIKKFSSEGASLSYSQRFKFNQLVQRYAVQNDLWRRRSRDKEEGRGRLGGRTDDAGQGTLLYDVTISDPNLDVAEVDRFVDTLNAAKRQAGGHAAQVSSTVLAAVVRDQIKHVLRAEKCARVRLLINRHEGKVEFDVIKANE